MLDIPCMTVRPALHYLLLGNPGGERRQDRLAQSLLLQYMPDEERQLLATLAWGQFAGQLRI